MLPQHHIPIAFLVLTFLVALLLPRAPAVGQPMFREIEPFEGRRYEIGYDTSKQGPTATAQPCIDFDSSEGINSHTK
jgi:hypothetical protein